MKKLYDFISYFKNTVIWHRMPLKLVFHLTHLLCWVRAFSFTWIPKRICASSSFSCTIINKSWALQYTRTHSSMCSWLNIFQAPQKQTKLCYAAPNKRTQLAISQYQNSSSEHLPCFVGRHRRKTMVLFIAHAFPVTKHFHWNPS
jgi:hypothetical protein